jgi:SAM-dependent methyltransferase
MTQTNSCSRSWFDFFHVPIGQERTAKEVEFISQCAPLPAFEKILDACCGMGRHARALASRGYSVTGVERDSAAIARARDLGGGPRYVHIDLQEYRPAAAAFDLAIVLSQSFGYFDAPTNRELLGRLANGVRKGGRIILDLWNPEFFAAHEGERNLETSVGSVRERKRVKGGRLFVHLRYPDGLEEDFEWQLFTGEEMRSLAESLALRVILTCTGFNSSRNPTAEDTGIQFVVER